MGNAPSSSREKRPPSQRWNWNWSSGRPVPVMRRGGTKAAPRKRPLFKRQPSNDYDWWIGNPNRRNNSNRRN